MKNNHDNLRPEYAKKMSIAAKARRAAAEGSGDDFPKNFSALAPRGPLSVKSQVVGLLVQAPDGGIVQPDKAFRETDFGYIYIDKKDLNGAPFKMTVVCEVLNPESLSGKFKGRIVEVLGDPGNNDVRMMSVIRQYGLSTDFPEEVYEEIRDLPYNPDPSVVEEKIRAGRKDLRDLLTITIDGEDAKDLDDAISVTRLSDGNYKLYVHIADVSDYVKEGTALDAQAMLRGTSVYLVDRVIPMLPPKLSNGLCSLNPDADRLALTCEMYVDSNGHTFGGEIYESVIRSDRRMSYNECFRILEDPHDNYEEEYGPIIGMLTEMKVLSSRLERMRKRKGAMEFDFPETQVDLDEDGNPVRVYPHPVNYTNGIIEQFMICANEFVAEKFSGLKYPFIYRIHENPDPVKLARFVRLAKSFGASGKLTGDITPYEVVSFMDTVKDESAKPLLDRILLRSMAKACYSGDNHGHFGLASRYYCHFTSPIRRYPDLYIHRIIKSYINGQDKKEHFRGLVDSVARHSSDMERNSIDAERASVNIKVCEYMAGHLGEHYDGVITSIISSGVFVCLESTAEGFIPFRLMRDRYIYDERLYRAIGSRSGMKLNIGMKVRVIVANVDMEAGRIDFVFEEGFERDRQKSGMNFSRRKSP